MAIFEKSTSIAETLALSAAKRAEEQKASRGRGRPPTSPPVIGAVTQPTASRSPGRPRRNTQHVRATYASPAINATFRAKPPLPQNVILLHIIAGWGPLSVSGLIFLAHMSVEKQLGMVGWMSGAIAMGVLVTTVRHVAIGIRRNTGKHWGEAFALAVSVDMTAVLMEYAALSPKIQGWYSTVAIVLWVAAICFSVALCVHAYRAADPARQQGDENGTR